jgi:hypothetical protein
MEDAIKVSLTLLSPLFAGVVFAGMRADANQAAKKETK